MKNKPFSNMFTGFVPRSLEFFHDLDRNNDRVWFAEHREEYDRFVLGPMTRLIADLVPMMLELDPRIVADPKRAIARIHRDVRFSNDKTPYWPYLWAAFRHDSNVWFHAPTYFFEIDGTGYSFGMNIYAPSAATMRRFREKIDIDPKAFLSVIDPIRRGRTFELKEDRYKRRLPCEHGPAIDPWYQSKSIAVLTEREPDKTLFSKKLVDLLMDRYVLLKPLYDFLWSVTVM